MVKSFIGCTKWALNNHYFFISNVVVHETSFMGCYSEEIRLSFNVGDEALLSFNGGGYICVVESIHPGKIGLKIAELDKMKGEKK